MGESVSWRLDGWLTLGGIIALVATATPYAIASLPLAIAVAAAGGLAGGALAGHALGARARYAVAAVLFAIGGALFVRVFHPETYSVGIGRASGLPIALAALAGGTPGVIVFWMVKAEARRADERWYDEHGRGNG